MGFFPREFELRKVRHHNFYELADKLESVSLLALFGGRRKEGELSLDTLEDVFICPLKTEKAGSLMSRVQNKNAASIVVKDASVFFNRLAQHHDVWMREIAAAGHGLSEEAVRQLAKDHGFDVCNVLAKNPENLFKLNVEELIAFVKRDEAIKSQVFQNLVHFSGFSEDMIEAGVIDKLKTFVEAFTNDPDGDLRETLEELRIRIEENDFVAPKTAHLRRRVNLSCTNPYGRIGEYVFAIGFVKVDSGTNAPEIDPNEPIFWLPVSVHSSLAYWDEQGVQEELLTRLAQSTSFDVRRELSERRDLPKAVVDKLKTDKSFIIRSNLLSRNSAQHLTDDEIREMLRGELGVMRDWDDCFPFDKRVEAIALELFTNEGPDGLIARESDKQGV